MIIETERFILKLLEKENAFKVFNILSKKLSLFDFNKVFYS